jgi:hypothetical protein
MQARFKDKPEKKLRKAGHRKINGTPVGSLFEALELQFDNLGRQELSRLLENLEYQILQGEDDDVVSVKNIAELRPISTISVPEIYSVPETTSARA